MTNQLDSWISEVSSKISQCQSEESSQVGKKINHISNKVSSFCAKNFYHTFSCEI